MEFAIVNSKVSGWFYVLINGHAVAEVDSIAQANEVIAWWKGGCKS